MRCYWKKWEKLFSISVDFAPVIQSGLCWISLTTSFTDWIVPQLSFLSASPSVDCTQEKSMFCRISADRTQGREMRYYPFRLTPYQLTIRDSDGAEPQPCCLLIADRVHSGYEGICLFTPSISLWGDKTVLFMCLCSVDKCYVRVTQASQIQ